MNKFMRLSINYRGTPPPLLPLPPVFFYASRNAVDSPFTSFYLPK